MRKYFKKNNKAREVLSMSKGFTRTPNFGVTPKGGGFTLVETLVAISIFTVSILGMMSVLASGVSNSRYAKQKIIAGYLAQEGIEYIRNMRDAYILYPTEYGTWNQFENEFNSCNVPSGNPHGCGIDSTKSVDEAGFLISCGGGGSTSCNLHVQDGNYNILVGEDSGFVRRVWTESVDAKEVKIFSKVEWTQGSGAKSVTFSENLFNWVK